jgi:hypothetical protein
MKTRKTALKIIICLVLFCIGAPKNKMPQIWLDETGLYINYLRITKDISPELLMSKFGIPDKITFKECTIWTYNKYGLIAYINPELQSIDGISLNFQKENYSISPKQTFSGKLVLFGTDFSEFSTLQSISELGKPIIENYPFHAYRVLKSKHTLTFINSRHSNDIVSIIISLK